MWKEILMSNLKKFESIAIEAASLAAETIMTLWGNHETSIKDDGSFVTNVDIIAEGIIRDTLSLAIPGTEICGEELNSGIPSTTEYWIIDPIDGTRWFNLGVPIFGTLIAYVQQGNPVIGVISLPVTNEIIYASIGSGCYYKKGQRKPLQIYVVNVDTIDNAVVSVSGLHGSDVWLEKGSKPYRISNLPKLSREFYFSGDCIQHSLVARGKVHAAVDTIMKPWDIAALIPCVIESGGYVCDLEGGTDNLLLAETLLSSCNKNLAKEIVSVL